MPESFCSFYKCQNHETMDFHEILMNQNMGRISFTPLVSDCTHHLPPLLLVFHPPCDGSVGFLHQQDVV